MRMKTLAHLIILIALSSDIDDIYAGDKGHLQWMSFNDGLALAQKANRKVLIDVYTDWCGWCKKMESTTYGDPRIVEYLQRKYVLVRLNAESMQKLTYKGTTYTERDLAGAFGVNGYPTTIFLKANGDPITGYPGYADAAKFRTVLSFIAEDHYLTKKFSDYSASPQ